ncbi:hypothetical protein DPSP01_002609 [Paraphaeosphaeria sporulosa]
MDNLPQELVDHISSYLGPEDLKHTLTVSPAFQVAAEKYSGAFSDFELNKENARRFVNTFGGRRLGYLQHLTFRSTIPALDQKVDWEAHPDGYPVRDSEEDLREADESFTDQIKFLFSIVKETEDIARSEKAHGKVKLTLYTPTRHIDRGNYSIQRAYVSWRVHLLEPESLPDLTSIYALRIENGMKVSFDVEYGPVSLWKIDLRMMVDLSNKFPNLAALHCSIGGDEWLDCNEDYRQRYITKDWAGPRRDSRHDFARILDVAHISGLRVARLNFLAPLAVAFEQREPFPDLVSPARHDPLSSSLRVLSYQLRRFSVIALIDPTLFWPAEGASQFWPNLQTLHVMFQIVSPSGDWYFNFSDKGGSKQGYEIKETDYPPYAETELDRTNLRHCDEVGWANFIHQKERTVPNDETLVPLLQSFARATSFMPRLKQAILWAPVRSNAMGEYKKKKGVYTNNVWGLVYTSPDTEGFMDCRGHQVEGNRQLWWQVANWRPDKATHEMLRQIGKDKHGEDIAEYWEHDYTISDRYEFERFESQLLSTGFPAAAPFIKGRKKN